jgi:hypothetical protein
MYNINTNATLRTTTSFSDIRIGYANNTNNYLDGVIDDIRIYNRILSEQEITALYYEGGYNPS